MDDVLERANRAEHLSRCFEHLLADLGETKSTSASLHQSYAAAFFERAYMETHDALRQSQLTGCCRERTRFGDRHEDGEQRQIAGGKHCAVVSNIAFDWALIVRSRG
ncbi:hypothetical protein AKJ09_05055 [Labilithrix luteola]|uniref:Uncharacterized protein n=1 Tax=Labilithrix luteola TaxID=1391654 RepID=A0A0K1PYD2_9BACT|nr:hypothetical protein AKJ09_05055 [Labilithrix luteola]